MAELAIGAMAERNIHAQDVFNDDDVIRLERRARATDFASVLPDVGETLM